MMASGSYERLKEWISFIMKSEVLDEVPEAPVGAGRTSFFSGILKSEALPFDEAVSEGESAPISSRLFASEQLPWDDRPAPGGGRPSFVATLFAREQLPVDPVPAPGLAGHSDNHQGKGPWQ